MRTRTISFAGLVPLTVNANYATANNATFDLRTPVRPNVCFRSLPPKTNS